MKKQIGVVLCGIICICMLSSCTTIMLDSRELLEPVQMNQAGTKTYTVVKSFTVNDKAGWLWIVPINKPAGDNQNYLKSILDAQIKEAGGDAAINVTLRAQSQPLDWIINMFVPLYTTRTVTITGDVIKYD